MCFDATYLTATFSQMTLHGKRVLVGSAYDPRCPQNCLLDLESDNVDLKQQVKATSMLDMIIWDPCGMVKGPLSICSLPINIAFNGPHCSERSGWAMMEIIGTCLIKSGGIVRGISFDNHGAHGLIRKVLHGQMQGIDLKQLEQIPFFGKLTHAPLPQNKLPRLPVQICLHEGQPFCGQPGPCSPFV